MTRRSRTSNNAKKPVRAWAAPAGALATAAAALMTACPVDVTVTVGSTPHTVVVSQADVPNPVCPIRPR